MSKRKEGGDSIFPGDDFGKEEKEKAVIRVSSMLPEISNYRKFVDAVPDVNYLTKGTLDKIYLWWAVSADVDEVTQKFEQFLSSEGIPELERGQCSKILESRKEDISRVYDGLNKFVAAKKPKWESAEKIYGNMREVNRRSHDDVHAVALLESIAATAYVGNDEKAIRRKIAQGAWGEMLLSDQYNKLYRRADVSERANVLDDYQTERDELTQSLKSKLWDEKRIAEQGVVYSELQKKAQAYRDEELLDGLEKVWNEVSGAGKGEMSALDILVVAQDVLVKLYRRG